MVRAMSVGPSLARRAHDVLEPMHNFIYFVPESGERYLAAGVKGGMRGYFASRSAALGRVPAEVVVATFYNFSPAAVAKAIPSVWDASSPQEVLAARLDAADAALVRLLGPQVVGSAAMAEAATLAREAATAVGAELAGRPLFAAHAALPWPQPPHLQLWHAATVLREHRGDAHIAALVLAGLSGAEAAVTYAATGQSMGDELMRVTRGYDEDEWAAVKAALQRQGLLEPDGQLTDDGARLRADIEAQTDAAALTGYRALGSDRSARLIELVTPWETTIRRQIFG